MEPHSVKFGVTPCMRLECKFWLEDDGWNATLESLGLTVHAPSFEPHGFQRYMRKRLREAAHQSIRFRVLFLRQESCIAPQPHDLQRQRPRPLCPVRTRSTIEWNWVDSQLLRQMDCSLHYNLCSL
jgi:hypothetical protein